MIAGKWYNSLRVQIVVLLSLALFPLGAIAINQTNQVEAEVERNNGLTLLALTKRAAMNEELIIERAIGAAHFFSVIAEEYIENPERCQRDLKAFLNENDAYSFIGILPPTGVVSCSSADEVYDLSDSPNIQQLLLEKQRKILVNKHAPLSGVSIFNVSEPFEIDGVFAGFVSVSIPHDVLPDTDDDLTSLGLLNLITINEDGDILTARGGLESAEDELPEGLTLQSLALIQRATFQSKNQNGFRRAYTFAPIVGSRVKVIGIWDVENRNGTSFRASIGPAVFPILMWMASMAVAILSVYMLVLRHLARMRRDMDNFAEHRIIAETTKTPIMPNELQALEDNFGQMTASILREEAEMEDILREKNVLIKEVHHRVKNNLQLISSIMNMKIRTAKHEETRSMLSRLQDRVLSLATIHRDLYQSKNGGLVNAGALLSEIVEKSAEVAAYSNDALDINADFDPVWLYPDQVVPLSLLVAEGMTNAMKYIGQTQEEGAWVKVSLKQEDTECVLTLANSIGDNADRESTGLGTQLINAFSIQLGGQIELKETAKSYALTLRFTIADFVPESRDF
jgi:two-component sensor histidine kinase